MKRLEDWARMSRLDSECVLDINMSNAVATVMRVRRLRVVNGAAPTLVTLYDSANDHDIVENGEGIAAGCSWWRAGWWLKSLSASYVSKALPTIAACGILPSFSGDDIALLSWLISDHVISYLDGCLYCGQLDLVDKKQTTVMSIKRNWKVDYFH